MPKKMETVKMGSTCMGCGCGCPHHKWTPSLTLIATGAVLLYTGSWAWAIIALGVFSLIGRSMCKCCGCGNACC